MIKIGDTIKVISKTLYDDKPKELIPIGTICNVISIEPYNKNNNIIGIIPINSELTIEPYYYLSNELEKGELVWVKCY